MDPLTSFIELSTILTGELVLERVVAETHYTHANAKIGIELVTLLAAFAAVPPDRRRDEFEAKIWNEPTLRSTAEKLTILWFVGGLPYRDAAGKVKFDYRDATGDVHAEGVFGALMWRVMRTHPPGLSGGYFGYWRYPPEN